MDIKREAASGRGEIVVYQPDEVTRLEVRVDKETVWLNRSQLSLLFGRDVKTIGKHINNALAEELKSVPTVAFFATVQKEGSRYVERKVEYYNLDMILSVGYRVKSEQGVRFRRWANEILKEYLLKGYSLNHRLMLIEERIDKKFMEHGTLLKEHQDKIDFFVRTSLPPVEGVFYDGQIFDAYVFATKNIHDRFLIVDDDVYHIGASLKDLGRKLFAFSKMTLQTEFFNDAGHAGVAVDGP